MEVGELQQTEAVEPKPMERRLLVYTCFRKASLGAHQGRAEDGAIAMGQQGAGMKNHSRPTKLSANSILLLLIFFFTFWAADLIAQNSRSPGKLFRSMLLPPASYTIHITSMTLHCKKPFLKWDFLSPLQPSTHVDTAGVIQSTLSPIFLCQPYSPN